MIDINVKQILCFFALACGFSWVVAGAIFGLGGLSSKAAQPLMFAFMCGPAFGALICAWVFNKTERVKVLGIKLGFNIWLVWAWLIAVIVVVGSTLLSGVVIEGGFQRVSIGYTAAIEASGLKVGDALTSKPGADAIIVASTLFINGIIISPLMLSEELGWRGWLYTHIRKIGFWRASFITGLMWGVWHAPIIVMGYNYPDLPILGPIIFTVFCILFSPLFTFVRDGNRSVWAPCILHGVFNASAGIGIMMLVDPPLLWNGALGVMGLAMIMIVNIWIFMRLKNKKK